MEAKDIGQQHGANVHVLGVFAVKLVVAFGQDIALNVGRVASYGVGFATRLVRGESTSPNA